MTTTITPPDLSANPDDGKSSIGPRARALGLVTGRWVGAILIALIIFSILIMTRGANPITVFSEAWANTIQSPFAMQQALVKAAPLILAALAVAIPARAGLVLSPLHI